MDIINFLTLDGDNYILLRNLVRDKISVLYRQMAETEGVEKEEIEKEYKKYKNLYKKITQ